MGDLWGPAAEVVRGFYHIGDIAIGDGIRALGEAKHACGEGAGAAIDGIVDRGPGFSSESHGLRALVGARHRSENRGGQEAQIAQLDGIDLVDHIAADGQLLGGGGSGERTDGILSLAAGSGRIRCCIAG